MRFKKALYITAIIICSLLLLTFIFISPITKYVIEKNSEQWLGRKIEIESLWINIFGGSVSIQNVQLFENKSDKVFFSVADFYCNIAVYKLLAGEYVVSIIKITKPEINIVQRGSHFNFDDMVLRFSDTAKVKTQTPSAPVKYFIKNFTINSGSINYSNTLPQTDISLLQFSISCAPITYSDSIYKIKTDFGLKSGGIISTLFELNSKSLAYNLKLNTEKLNLNLVFDYVKDYLKIKSLSGFINSDLAITGNFNKTQDVALKGKVDIEGFSLVDTTGEKLAGFGAFNIDIDSINTRASIYNFNSTSVDQLYVKFAMYDDGYNFDRILAKHAVDTSTTTAPLEDYSNIFQMMARYIKEVYSNYVLNEYRFEKLEVKNADVVFTDYTIEDKFQYVLDSLNISSTNFNSQTERILITLSSGLNRSGVMAGTLSVNPDGFNDMDISYSIKDLLISDINPYSKYYVATPFLDGKILFENKSIILNNKLKSTNRLFIEKIKVGNKVKNKTAFDLPVKLAVALLRDPKGNIDFEIPVEGDLSDPKYKLGKVIWQVFKNLIIKAATAPFKLLANAFGGREEDYKEVQFQYLQKGLNEDQIRVLDNLQKMMKEKLEIKIEFVQVSNKEDEVEQLALYTAKMQYLGFAEDSLSLEQHKQLMELSNKDSIFDTWVDAKLGIQTGLTSVQDKCIKYFGKEKLIAEVNQIMEQRNSFLLNYFISKGVEAQRIKITNVKDENQAQKESIPRYVLNFFTDENASTSLEEPSPKN